MRVLGESQPEFFPSACFPQTSLPSLSHNGTRIFCCKGVMLLAHLPLSLEKSRTGFLLCERAGRLMENNKIGAEAGPNGCGRAGGRRGVQVFRRDANAG